MLFSTTVLAQVGINTESPKATLDIVASPTDLNKIDGVIAPRILGNDLANKDALYTTAQTGAIVYVTAAVSTPTAKTINVTSVGYYYFDGTVWVKMTSPTVTADNGLTKTGNNIQLGGTLLKNTEIVSAGFNTSFSGTGNVGIGTNVPSERLDLGTGNVRIRDINGNVGNGTTDRRVVADANGVLKTVNNDDYNFFHARLSNDQTLSSDAITNTVLFNTPIATSPFYTYNNTTGILTFNSPGLYFITYQGGFSDFAAGTHLLLGIINVATGQYIGRGSNWSALARSGTVGQISSYTTMINVPNSGYQVRFMAYAGASGSATLLANESGASGSGNVTNLTIQKTR